MQRGVSGSYLNTASGRERQAALRTVFDNLDAAPHIGGDVRQGASRGAHVVSLVLPESSR